MLSGGVGFNKTWVGIWVKRGSRRRSSLAPCRVQAPAAFQDGTLLYEAG